MLIDYYIDLEVIHQKYKIYYEIAILRVRYILLGLFCVQGQGMLAIC